MNDREPTKVMRAEVTINVVQVAYREALPKGHTEEDLARDLKLAWARQVGGLLSRSLVFSSVDVDVKLAEEDL